MLLKRRDPDRHNSWSNLRADGFPSLDVIDKLIPYNFVGTPQNWEWAETYLKQVREKMDKDLDSFDMDALIARRQRPPLH